MTYQLVYADPPWSFGVRSAKGEGRSAKNHYNVMKLDDIKSLDVGSISSKDSVLLMWAIDPMLDAALDVIKSWGFKYKTVGLYWVKQNLKSPGFFTGLGFYTRANPEQCLLATKGNGLSRINAGVQKLVVSPRTRHSEKPAEVRNRIVSLFGDVSRVELFARCSPPGWDVWGNEVNSDVEVTCRANH